MIPNSLLRKKCEWKKIKCLFIEINVKDTQIFRMFSKKLSLTEHSVVYSPYRITTPKWTKITVKCILDEIFCVNKWVDISFFASTSLLCKIFTCKISNTAVDYVCLFFSSLVVKQNFPNTNVNYHILIICN